MAGKSKGWTAEKRAAQAEIIRQRKPWLKSTGPKTVEGKQRAAMNAQTHGQRSAEFTEQIKILRALLRIHRARLKNLSPVIPTFFAELQYQTPAQGGGDDCRSRHPTHPTVIPAATAQPSCTAGIHNARSSSTHTPNLKQDRHDNTKESP